MSEREHETERPVDSPSPKPHERQTVGIDRFAEIELRVARILAAERVPNADRLLRLQIDLGTEKRQIVAGIAKVYEPETLIGRSIVVVANLAPAQIRGIESQGMLLAADGGAGPIVVGPQGDVPPGTRVR